MHHGCCARTPHFIRQGQGGEDTSRRTPWIPIRHRPGPMLSSLRCMCVHLGRPPLTKTAGPTLPLACTRYPVPEWDVATGSGSGRTGVRGSGLGRDLIHRSQAPPPASPQHPSPGTAHRPPQPTPTHYQAHPPGTPTRHAHQAPPGTHHATVHTRPGDRRLAAAGGLIGGSAAGGLQRPALVQWSQKSGVPVCLFPPHERCLTREGARAGASITTGVRRPPGPPLSLPLSPNPQYRHSRFLSGPLIFFLLAFLIPVFLFFFSSTLLLNAPFLNTKSYSIRATP